MDHLQVLLFICILASASPRCHSWSWFSFSSDSQSSGKASGASYSSYGSVAEFSMESLQDTKGIKLLENARSRMVGSNSCWQNAYRHLMAGCSDIVATEEKRSRFAWHLSDCFQTDSGRTPFPFCDTESAMVNCLKKLDDHEHRVFLEFLLETNTICYQLQSHAFKHETERLVNELKNSAEKTELKLETLDKKSDILLQSSKQIHDSLNSVDLGIQNVAQTTQNLEGEMDGLMQHTMVVYQQAKDIAASQSELREGQVKMNERLTEGMEMLNDAYSNLGQGIDDLRNETIEIENEIGKLGTVVSSRMNDLQAKADDIGNMAGISLGRQQELLDGQSIALDGLRFLTKFQSEALEESRNTLQQLVEYGHKQQEELLNRQKQLQEVHDHLVENSKSILAAQETFEAKQASMFIALDKLFALHNAMLLESRLIKAFLIYSMSIFIIYMFTSTKQTYIVRPKLYIGLCVTLLVEVAILRFTDKDIEQQTWIINLVRSSFLLFASIQLLHAIFTYRDYEVLNHQILLTLVEKINDIQYDKENTDSDVNWSSWIDADLTEYVNNLDDPDYRFAEEIGENSVTTCSATRKYNLRHRHV